LDDDDDGESDEPDDVEVRQRPGMDENPLGVEHAVLYGS